MTTLQSVSRRLHSAGFMVTYERNRKRLWVGNGKGQFLGCVTRSGDNYVVSLRGSRDYAATAETVCRWFRAIA